MMKNKSYVRKVAVIATADIQNGNKDKLLKIMPDLISNEDYETCEGIQKAIQENCTHEFISREYSSQPYGTCVSCGKTIIDF